MSHERIVERAQAAWAAAGSPGVRLALEEVVVDYEGVANAVLRCRVEGASGSEDVPPTVVVKASNIGEGHLRHEWAGLEFLAGVEGAADLVPRLFAASAEDELLVLEDLGDAKERQVGWMLFGDDRPLAEAALLEMQRALGRLHAATIGRADAFAAARDRRGATSRSRHRIHRIADALEEMRALPGRLGVEAPGGFDEELSIATALLAAPGGFLAFTHGDPTAANAFHDATTGSVRYYDLETCGFRHALLDGTFADIRYIHSVWARALPAGLRRRLLEEYRGALATGCAEASDDLLFGQARVACGAGWLAGLLQLLPEVEDADRKWGRTTNRQRVVAGLAHFAGLAEEVGRFPSTGEWCRRVERQLRERWSPEECDMRPYPFSEGEGSPG